MKSTPFGSVPSMAINFDGSRTGNGRSKTVSIRLKIAVFAPMPSAIEMMASAVKMGRLNKLA